MKSAIAAALSAAGLAAGQAILDFQVLHSEAPSLSSATPIPTSSTNTQSIATSITDKLISASSANSPMPTLTTQKTLTTPKSVKPSPTKKSKKPAPKKTKKVTLKKTKKAKKPIKKANVKGKGHEKRQATPTSSSGGTCASQAIYYTYTPVPNTPTGFLTDTTLAGIAQVALAPAGYTQSFRNQYGSIFASNYLGYIQMNNYNISQCTALCAAYPGCTAINTYFERDPVQDPGSACPNPTSGVSARCALWGTSITAAQALNIGEFRTNFMVVVQGSNGYTVNTPPPAQTNFTGPVALAGGIATSAGSSFITSSFQAGPYDQSFCSALCQSTTQINYNAAVAAVNPNYAACNYFNTFKVSYNGTLAGTYCKLYTDSSQASAANVYTQASNNGASYDITYSYAYSLTNNDTGVLPPSVLAAASASRAAAAASSTSAAKPTQTPAQANLVASCSQIGSTGSFVDSNNVTYAVKCSYDLLNAGDIGNKGVTSFAACFAACDATSGCQAIAYTGGTGAGTCYFKSLKGVTQQPNANTAVDLAWQQGTFPAYKAADTATTTAKL